MMKAAEEDYLKALHSLRTLIDEVRSDIDECQQDHPQYVTEQGWTEADYKFHSALQVSALNASFSLGRKVMGFLKVSPSHSQSKLVTGPVSLCHNQFKD